MIGNPPYVNVKDITYDISQINYYKFPDIYALVIKRAIDISNKDGRNGMIIPLSITFSSEFEELRLFVCKNGDTWFSSYDNIPAAIFSGVSQRCTIWINSKQKNERYYTGPMRRWRASFRSFLVDSIIYLPFKIDSIKTNGIPKLNSNLSAKLLNNLFLDSTISRNSYPKNGKYRIGFAQAARNFISVFLEDPPCLDAKKLCEVKPSKIGYVYFDKNEGANGALSLCAGETLFYYWLIRGDGFDVTTWIMKDYLMVLNKFPTSESTMLHSLGNLIDMYKNNALVFKKNAGKYVGNYNYRKISAFTKRSDLILLKRAGFSKIEVFSFFDEIHAILSVNEFAGERSIPVEIKSMYPHKSEISTYEANLIALIDNYLIENFGFTEEELDFIINYDIKYRMGRDGDTADSDE